jgi:hypothetical protein
MEPKEAAWRFLVVAADALVKAALAEVAVRDRSKIEEVRELLRTGKGELAVHISMRADETVRASIAIVTPGQEAPFTAELFVMQGPKAAALAEDGRVRLVDHATLN